MFLRFNREAVDKVRRAELQGKTKEEMKPLYIEQNLFDVDIDEPVQRIVQAKHLITDLNNRTLTHIKAGPLVWDDPYENPLLKSKYPDESTGASFTLAGTVEHFYAVCLSKGNEESINSWRAYSSGKPTVRITTTPRLLMDRVMHVDDNYCMLHHYMGKVRYLPEDDLINWLQNTHYTEHLDSLGQSIALSAMTLRTDYSEEKEIRLLYSYKPQQDAPWVRENVKATGKTCAVPFNWEDIIGEITIGPYMSIEDEKIIKNALDACGINCEVKNSQFRSIKG